MVTGEPCVVKADVIKADFFLVGSRNIHLTPTHVLHQLQMRELSKQNPNQLSAPTQNSHPFWAHKDSTENPVKVPALNFSINLPVKYFIVLISSDDNAIILWLLSVN